MKKRTLINNLRKIENNKQSLIRFLGWVIKEIKPYTPFPKTQAIEQKIKETREANQKIHLLVYYLKSLVQASKLTHKPIEFENIDLCIDFFEEYLQKKGIKRKWDMIG